VRQGRPHDFGHKSQSAKDLCPSSRLFLGLRDANGPCPGIGADDIENRDSGGLRRVLRVQDGRASGVVVRVVRMGNLSMWGLMSS
jgi:hypothetical protein